MQVKAITPRGYCKGVVRAIEMAKKAQNEKKPIVILGMIVHNKYIVEALKEMGIETIDHPGKTRLELLDEIHEGTVIITAHGAGDQVFKKARDKGLHVIDASCLDVIKTHNVIKTRLKEGMEAGRCAEKGARIARRRIFTRMLMDGMSAAVYLLTFRWAYFSSVFSAHRDFRKVRVKVTVPDIRKYLEEHGSVAMVTGMSRRWIIPTAVLYGKRIFNFMQYFL